MPGIAVGTKVNEPVCGRVYPTIWNGKCVPRPTLMHVPSKKQSEG